jgi:hypothetical protein
MFGWREMRRVVERARGGPESWVALAHFNFGCLIYYLILKKMT